MRRTRVPWSNLVGGVRLVARWTGLLRGLLYRMRERPGYEARWEQLGAQCATRSGQLMGARSCLAMAIGVCYAFRGFIQ